MTRQEAYEKVRAWFSRPNARFGYDADAGECKYRANEKANDLRRCAIGCLIPPKDYGPDLEGLGAQEIQAIAIRVPALNGLDGEFAVALQQCHDELADDFGYPGLPEKERLTLFIKRLDGLAGQRRLQKVTP